MNRISAHDILCIMKNQTDIRFIVDRSGSMSSIAVAMKDGFKEFINGQKVTLKDQNKKNRKNHKALDSTVVSVYLFDDQYEVSFENRPIEEVSELTLVPRGMTALFDGIGKTINSVGEQLAKKDEEERPNKVVFVIITDGKENHSSEFKFPKIVEMVKHQKEKYNWEFIFLGANIDSFEVGGSLGFAKGSTRNYTPTYVGVNEAWQSLSRGVTKMSLNKNSRLYDGLDASEASFCFDDNGVQTTQNQAGAGAYDAILNASGKIAAAKLKASRRSSKVDSDKVLV